MLSTMASTMSSTTTTTTSNTSPTWIKKKRKHTASKLSTKPKKEWANCPTSNILLEFIKETFVSKAKISSKIPINDFIQYYDRKLKLDKGWLKPIVRNLTPFITFLRCSSAKQIDKDSITSSISFFKSKLNNVSIQLDCQQIMKDDLVIAVENSFDKCTERESHPLVDFLNKDKEQYNKEDGWLLNLLGSREAKKKYRRNKLELNVKIIATILYSIMCTTCGTNDVDILACSLGANAKKEEQRRRYLNDIAQDTIQEYFEIEHTTGDDATATTASISQSSATNTDSTTASTASLTQSSESHHRQAPTVITANIEKGLSKFNDNDNISPLTVHPSSTTTTATSSFSFTPTPLKNTRRPDWDDMSIGSPPPNQQNTPHGCDDFSFGSPTPKQATKKIRAGPTPNMNTPSNKGNRRVLFTDEFPSRVTTTTVATSTASIPAPSSLPARVRATTTTPSRCRHRQSIANDRLRGVGVGMHHHHHHHWLLLTKKSLEMIRRFVILLID